MSNPQGYKVHASMVLVSGDRMQHHIESHQKKLQRCPYDCGMDIYPTGILSELHIPTGVEFVLTTGFHLTPTPGTYALLTDRSSTLKKLDGGQVLDGKIDAGYTGELLIRVYSPEIGHHHVREAIKRCAEDGMAVAQVIIHIFCLPMCQPRLESGLIVPLSDLGGRGANGFGSTDKVS